MKAIITIIFTLFIGFAAQAKDASVEVAFEQVKLEVVKAEAEKQEVARLYRFKNSRVKKELTFTTKRTKAKLA